MRTSLLYAEDPLYTEYHSSTVFADLHIDQILNAVTEGAEEYHLCDIYRRKPILRTDVEFRQAVARDFSDDLIRNAIEQYLKEFSRAKRYLKASDEAGDTLVKDKWHLDAALAYCGAINGLLSERAEVGSEGLKRFLRWLKEYASCEAYRTLDRDAAALDRAFDAFRYSVQIDIGNDLLVVGEDGDNTDFLGDLLSVFDRFDLGAVRRDAIAFSSTHMNSLEKRMISLLVQANPGLFEEVHSFREGSSGFLHEKLLSFERHAYFYLTYLANARRMEEKGHIFAMPSFGDTIRIDGGYDMSLAQMEKKETVVANDLSADEGERCLLLTGPNQGGKTTFARMLGQIFFFASVGLPVPCRSAELFFPDDIRTHFAREEEPGSRSGRLQEELTRLKEIVGVKRNSVVILNELFASTTTHDACEMGARALRSLTGRGCLCLFVTHIHELTRVLPEAVSLVAEADGGDPPVCTYRILRKPSDGAVYAARLLAKYRLRQSDIEERKHDIFAALL